jgi:dGTP triphosphohydrolase
MSPRKTQKLRTFVKLDKKPVAQKGIQYSFETVGVVSDIPGLKGDIVKKYVNGKLKEQKFVTRDKLRKFVQSASRKENKRMVKQMVGGKKTQKVVRNAVRKAVVVPKLLPVQVQKNKQANIQITSNTQQLLADQKKKEMELLERHVVAQENMVKVAETGNNLDKGLLALIGIDVGMEVFDHL